MEVVDLRRELERREREILKDRRKLQLHERRARRHKELKLNGSSGGTDKVPIAATTLSGLETLTSRLGFLRQQLVMEDLTALRRWHLQLQLMVAEDSKETQGTTVADGDDALQSFETELLRDQRCYDVVYRAGVRVSDARESLLDESAPVDVRELLSFSTRSESFVCRVTCLHDGKRVLFSSSKFVENLQTELERLVNEANTVNAVISFIWNALKDTATRPI